MLGAVGDLLKSEKAVAAGVLAVCATVMVFLGRMTVEEWTSYTQVVLVTYVSGKTLQGAVATVANRKDKLAPTVAPEPEGDEDEEGDEDDKE
jgi:hypothetical protein